MLIKFRERLDAAFSQKPWLAVIVGVAFLALCFAIQAEMVQTLPPSP